MAEKKVNNAFTPRPTVGGCETGSAYYVDRQVVLEFVETGRDAQGKAVGSVQPVIHDNLIDIDELVQSHASEVGVKNLILLYNRTGDASIFNARTPLPAGDYSNLPTESADEIFAKIPDELKAGRSMQDFLKTLTKEQLISYINSVTGKKDKEIKKEEKEVKSDE